MLCPPRGGQTAGPHLWLPGSCLPSPLPAQNINRPLGGTGFPPPWRGALAFRTPCPPPQSLSVHCALPPPLPLPVFPFLPFSLCLPFCLFPLLSAPVSCPVYASAPIWSPSSLSFLPSLTSSLCPLSPHLAPDDPFSLTLYSCSVSLAHTPPLPWGSWPRWVPSYLGPCYLLLEDRQASRLGAVGDQGPTPHFIVWQTPDPVFCGTKRQLAQQALGRESGGPRSPGPAGFLRRAALSIVSPARTAETLASSHMALPLPGPCPEAALTNTRWGWACDGVPTSCQSRERGNLRKVGWRPGFEFRLSHSVPRGLSKVYPLGPLRLRLQVAQVSLWGCLTGRQGTRGSTNALPLPSASVPRTSHLIGHFHYTHLADEQN